MGMLFSSDSSAIFSSGLEDVCAWTGPGRVLHYHGEFSGYNEYTQLKPHCYFLETLCLYVSQRFKSTIISIQLNNLLLGWLWFDSFIESSSFGNLRTVFVITKNNRFQHYVNPLRKRS